MKRKNFSHQNRFELCYRVAIVQGTIKCHWRNIFNYFILLHCFLHWKYTPTCECLSHINYVFYCKRYLSVLKKKVTFFQAIFSSSCPIELRPHESVRDCIIRTLMTKIWFLFFPCCQYFKTESSCAVNSWHYRFSVCQSRCTLKLPLDTQVRV